MGERRCRHSYIWFKFIFVLTGLISCNDEKSNRSNNADKPSKHQSGLVKYATGFEIVKHEDYNVVNVFYPNNPGKVLYKYILLHRGKSRPADYDDAILIETPIKSFVALSTMYVAYADELGVLGQLKGVSEIKYVNSNKVWEMHRSNKIVDLGSNSALNIEKIYELNPDVIVCYTYGKSEYEIHPKLHQAGLKIAIHAEQLETDPLGRMEWIKFFAVLFEKEHEADSLFNLTEKRYRHIKDLAAKASSFPRVFTDVKYGDTWFMPGGKSFLSKLLSDAHAKYLWSADTNKGSIPLSFEAVYEKAHDAEYWINLSDWNSRHEIEQNDLRYRKFKAFKTGNLFNYNKRVNEFSGNDYWESGMLHPDWILADLVKIFHPNILPDHEFIYYKRISNE